MGIVLARGKKYINITGVDYTAIIAHSPLLAVNRHAADEVAAKFEISRQLTIIYYNLTRCGHRNGLYNSIILGTLL